MVVKREKVLTSVIEQIGLLTRDFAASGSYPFTERRLTRAQMNLMFVLSRTADASVTELASNLGVTMSAVSQTLDALREAGLVTTEVSSADRRARIIRLTPAARVEVDAFERGYVEALAPRFDVLSVEELTQLDRTLSAIGASR